MTTAAAAHRPLTEEPVAGGTRSAAPETPAPARQGRRPLPRWRTLLTALVAALLATEVVLLAPRLSAALTRLTGADPVWVVVALAAAAVSMGFFARTRRRLLAAAGVRVRQRDALAAVYVANAMHVTLPGGAAFSTAWTYRWMRARGASGPATAWTLLAGGVLSTATLAVLGLTGSLLAGRAAGLTGVTVDTAVIGLFIAGLAVVRRRSDLLAAGGRRAARAVDRVLQRPPGRSLLALHGLVNQVAAVRPRGADWLTAALFALANWLLDTGCLAASARAVGLHGLPVSLLLLTYTAGMATSSLSLLPAGVGLVDGAMVLALTAGGLPAATALPVVLLYRLISVGGVVAVGWCLVALRPLLRAHHQPMPSGSGTGVAPGIVDGTAAASPR